MSEPTRKSGRLERRGPALYLHEVVPDKPRAWVAIVPGYADHGARYAHVMDAWAEAGLGCVAIDLRGHGRAEGPRGYCDRFDDYMDDLLELKRAVEARAQGAKVFLFGHSFGGLATATAVLRGAWTPPGLVLSSPYLGLKLQVPAVKIWAAKIASRIYPAFSQPSGLKGADVTRHAERAKAYDEDPLVFSNASARWFVEAKAAQARLFAEAASIRVPLLCVQGGADKVADPAAARAFVEAAGSMDKAFDERADMYHELLNDPEWREVADRVSAWMLERT
jgi:alpha-beta hydrolase superfamily lysophospholipase